MSERSQEKLTGCFIENQDIGLFDERAGDGDALFLAA